MLRDLKFELTVQQAAKMQKPRLALLQVISFRNLDSHISFII